MISLRHAPMLALLTIVCRTRSEQQLADRPELMRDQAPSVRLHLMTIERRSDVTDIRVRAWLAGEPAMGEDWRCLRSEWYVGGQKRERVLPRVGACGEDVFERRYEHTFSLASSGRAAVGVTLWTARGRQIGSASLDVLMLGSRMGEL